MKSRINEHEIINEFINGNNEILCNNYYSFLLNVSRKYCHTIEDAEDLVQDFLVKIISISYENRKKIFTKVNSIKAFIFSSIRNFAFDRLKKKKLKIVECFENQYFIDESSDIEFELNIEIVGLSNKELIYMKNLIEGQALDVISKENGVSKSTVKNTIQNAKKKIREYYLVKN